MTDTLAGFDARWLPPRSIVARVDEGTVSGRLPGYGSDGLPHWKPALIETSRYHLIERGPDLLHASEGAHR
jgi:hypothetical protein